MCGFGHHQGIRKLTSMEYLETVCTPSFLQRASYLLRVPGVLPCVKAASIDPIHVLCSSTNLCLHRSQSSIRS
jgi:hypothetical protein